MDANLAKLILNNRKISYAITDRNLQVIEVYGLLPSADHDHRDWRGRSLLDCVPELFGSERRLTKILNGTASHMQLLLVNREIDDGSTAFVTIEVLPYRDQTGPITGLIYLVQDASEWGVLEQQVTQQRNELGLLHDHLEQQNRQLKTLNAELQQLDTLKTQFVSIAAHELRSPMATVFGYLELLLDDRNGALNPQQQKFVKIASNGTRRLITISNDLLDTTQIESGQVELLLKPENLLALVETVAAESKPQLTLKNQQLIIHADSDLPLALCDDTKTVQIITNLISNASKYTPEDGKITVRLSNKAQEGFLQVAVTDTGVGIPSEDQEKLFTRFFRATTAHLTGASGTGLGLHITRSLVELHGGRIWFESQLNRGSTFYFTLPVADDLLSSWSNPDEFFTES